jgi:Transposase DDE domain group 1
LYGKQEGAVIGYNPHKPGRPSHSYHTFSIANLRIILEVEVQAGNETAASYTSPGLWSLLKRIPKNQWPKFIRGDCAFGTDGVMSGAEAKGLDYLFKIKQTKNVKRLIEKLMLNRAWTNAGQGWEGQESSLQLMGWSKSRRVIVLRRRITKHLAALTENPETKQLSFDFAELEDAKTRIYEYAVLVTSLPNEIITIAQHYRDRADSENIFDELKNQWGWGGFTTKDLKRCRLSARTVGLIYNWWNLFVRLADPEKHLEATTSRPLLLHAVAKQITHAGQKRIKITSTHGKTAKVKMLLNRIVTFFKSLKDAEQLSPEQRWYTMLSKALEKYLNGRLLQPPNFITQHA